MRCEYEMEFIVQVEIQIEMHTKRKTTGEYYTKDITTNC